MLLGGYGIGVRQGDKYSVFKIKHDLITLYLKQITSCNPSPWVITKVEDANAPKLEELLNKHIPPLPAAAEGEFDEVVEG